MGGLRDGGCTSFTWVVHGVEVVGVGGGEQVLHVALQGVHIITIGVLGHLHDGKKEEKKGHMMQD